MAKTKSEKMTEKLQGMTVADLKSLDVYSKIDGRSKMKKAELIEAIVSQSTGSKKVASKKKITKKEVAKQEKHKQYSDCFSGCESLKDVDCLINCCKPKKSEPKKEVKSIFELMSKSDEEPDEF